MEKVCRILEQLIAKGTLGGYAVGSATDLFPSGLVGRRSLIWLEEPNAAWARPRGADQESKNEELTVNWDDGTGGGRSTEASSQSTVSSVQV